MTGAGFVGAGSGVQMLSVRQSSLVPCARPPPRALSCGQMGPREVASSGALHEAAAFGAFHRRSPTGGAAYGMPRKTRVLPDVEPCTGPLSVWTSVPPPPELDELPPDPVEVVPWSSGEPQPRKITESAAKPAAIK